MTGLKKLKEIFTNLQNLSLTLTKEENNTEKQLNKMVNFNFF